MKKVNEPKLWVTVLKLVVGAVLIIGGVGSVLWWASKAEKSDSRAPLSNIGWGISTDSPIRNNR